MARDGARVQDLRERLLLDGAGAPMRTALTLLAALCACLGATSSRAQDLLVNGGFEAYSRCPTGPGVIDGWLDSWHRTSLGSTDFHHQCGFNGHLPRTGLGHVGMLTYDFSPNFREYLT